MHRIPTSAFSSASSTGSGALLTGRGPKSSSNSPVISAPLSCSAFSKLAATPRLASSAISVTHSFARTPRQTSTAFFAPGISSFGAIPKDILTILPELLPLPIRPNTAFPRQNAPLDASRCHPERWYLPSAARHIRQSCRAQPRQKSRQLSAEQIRREIHEHVPECHLAARTDVRKHVPADRDALLHDPASMRLSLLPTGQSFINGALPMFRVRFPSQRHPHSSVLITGLQHQVLPAFPYVLQ